MLGDSRSVSVTSCSLPALGARSAAAAAEESAASVLVLGLHEGCLNLQRPSKSQL